MATAGVLLLSAGPLQAGNIQRGCNVLYNLHAGVIRSSTNIHLIRIADFIPTPRSADGRHGRWEFSARGGCGNLVPNRCRERASKAALTCMLAHQKSPTRKPEACTKNDVQNYQLDNLEREVRHHVCNWIAHNDRFYEPMLPRPYRVNIDLQAYIYGDTGCGGSGKAHMTRSVYQAEVICPIQ